MKKLIDFKDTEKKVAQYAKKHCEGNFSMAVRKLINKGLSSDARSNKNGF